MKENEEQGKKCDNNATNRIKYQIKKRYFIPGYTDGGKRERVRRRLKSLQNSMQNMFAYACTFHSATGIQWPATVRIICQILFRFIGTSIERTTLSH